MTVQTLKSAPFYVPQSDDSTLYCLVPKGTEIEITRKTKSTTGMLYPAIYPVAFVEVKKLAFVTGTQEATNYYVKVVVNEIPTIQTVSGGSRYMRSPNTGDALYSNDPHELDGKEWGWYGIDWIDTDGEYTRLRRMITPKMAGVVL